MYNLTICLARVRDFSDASSHHWITKKEGMATRSFQPLEIQCGPPLTGNIFLLHHDKKKIQAGWPFLRVVEKKEVHMGFCVAKVNIIQQSVTHF